MVALDSDLSQVVDAWPGLDEPIKRAVLALINSAAESQADPEQTTDRSSTRERGRRPRVDT